MTNKYWLKLKHDSIIYYIIILNNIFVDVNKTIGLRKNTTNLGSLLSYKLNDYIDIYDL